jgi:hypothetical protein
MEAELMGALTQFGVAGLICWMWLVERRASAERERQMTEAHRALMEQRDAQEMLVDVVRENTRALSMLEGSQRELIGAIERLGVRSDRRAS